VGSGNFSHHHFRTGSGAHLASYPIDTRISFPDRVKRPGCEANHLPPFSAEVKNAWNCVSSPLIHLHGVVLT